MISAITERYPQQAMIEGKKAEILIMNNQAKSPILRRGRQRRERDLRKLMIVQVRVRMMMSAKSRWWK